MLTILDALTKFSPAIVPRFSWRETGDVEALERVCKEIGFPRTIRVDQNPEFISKVLDLWAYQRGAILDYSRPGKPIDYAFIELSNGKLRTECLNVHWFTTLDGDSPALGWELAKSSRAGFGFHLAFDFLVGRDATQDMHGHSWL